MGSPPFDIETLRQMLFDQPESGLTRAVAVLVSLALLGTVLLLVQRGKLREEYTPIWIGLGAGVLVLSLWLELLRVLTRAVGAWTPSSTLFFFGLLFLLLLCLQYAVRLSSLTLRLKLLTQEVALLRSDLEARHGRDLDRATPPV